VKIGFTNDLNRRLTALQTSSPSPLRVLASFAGTAGDEQAMHQRFHGKRVFGEWFAWCDEIAALIESLARAQAA
jgi:hypothetical protein